MSVLIRGLRMPDGCGDCPFCSKPMYNKYGYAYYQCDAPAAEANGRDITGKVLAMYCNGEKESFPNFCPLAEVPTHHGRLIDAYTLKDVQQAHADFFKGSSDYGEKCRYDEAINAVANIVNAPTIIEAERYINNAEWC